MNGSAFLRNKKQNKYLYDKYDKETHELLMGALSDKLNTFTNNEIKFAWEETKETKSVRNLARQIIRCSEIVVVIGYSFPIFNREIDIEIFKEFKGKKIYIQDTA